MEALDEEQLEQGAWDENVLDIEAGSENDVDAVGNEYEGGDEDDEGGWEMEVNSPCSAFTWTMTMRCKTLHS